MNALTLFLLLIPGAYLVGAVPWGLLIGKWSSGVDVRSIGSGNIGTSNVLRSIGAKQAALVLLLDVAKGTAAVLTATALADVADLSSLETSYLEMSAAVAALVGHNWPIYLNFKGGRGVATGLGGMPRFRKAAHRAQTAPASASNAALPPAAVVSTQTWRSSV